MTREWAPGDVAMDPSPGCGRGVVVEKHFSGCPSSHFDGLHIHYGDGDWNGPNALTRSRPLLVLDPESDDDAHRLIRAFWDHGNDDCDDVQAMRDAMRSLVAPPEPPKPEVYEHFVERAVDDLSRALCGKVWAPKGDAVTVIGKCPDCAHLKRSMGWSA